MLDITFPFLVLKELNPEAHLQRGAVLGERRAEEGDDGVEDHVDDVLLQDGIRKTLIALIAHLPRKRQKP